MRSVEKATLIDEELKNLHLRFELLAGDRKAFFETSEWTKRQNKEQIAKLRNEIKELRESVSRLRKSETEGRMTVNEIEKLDQRISELHKSYDQMTALVKLKEEKYQEMRDQLRDLSREAESVKITTDESPAIKQIRSLENRLDKATIKYNEALSIEKTYLQMLKRLEEEQLTFDKQLELLEQTLKSKGAEMVELEAMSRDALHAKELAKNGYIKFEQQVNDERKLREKELQNRREMVRAKKEQYEKMERKMQQSLKTNALDTNVLAGENGKEQIDEEKEKLVHYYEDWMKTIKEATGVSDTNDVIQKFLAQGDTHKHLMGLQEQYEIKITELKTVKQQTIEAYEHAKSLGQTKHAHSRRIIEEFEQKVSEANARCKTGKENYDSIKKIVLNAKAGVQHLSDKLEGVSLEQDDGTKLSMSDETVITILNNCKLKLQRLFSSVKDREDRALPSRATDIALPPYNTRVRIKPVEFEDSVAAEDDEDEEEHEEVLDRDTIKRQTKQMLDSKSKVKHPKRKPKKKGTKI